MARIEMRARKCGRAVYAVGVLLVLATGGNAARGQQAQRIVPLTLVPTLNLAVDAGELPRGIVHVRETVPAAPGAFTLVYPKWIPGEHGPTGPIANLVGLKISAGGAPVAWRRDDVDMFAFHCAVPAGAAALDVSFDFVSPATAHDLGMITWNQLVLYPAGQASDAVTMAARLKLPDGWKHATALPEADADAAQKNETVFKPVSLTTLVDSPVIVGEHLYTVQINPGQSPPHFIDMVSDTDASMEMTPELAAGYGRLVDEAGALFGARHYTQYHWLVTMHASGGGLEHHESSDDRVEENTLASDAGKRRLAGLLAHEYIHSWNGKYRRPEGLATPNYQEPMKGELLWVYEGLTEYLATILCPRAGLLTADDFHEKLAETVASMDYTAGRSWRPLIDTTIGAQVLYQSPAPWRDYRRSTDFYPEGILLWLEVDVMIRQQTQGKKSLNDFCRAFHGGPSGPPMVKPYAMDEVVATLNAVSPFDWKTFLDTRLNSTGAPAPMNGITGGGWKLVYTQTPSDDMKYREGQGKAMNLTYSLGLTIGNDDGAVRDIVPGLAADKAGIAPGMKLAAVNGRKWSPEILKAAVQESKTAKGPLELLVVDNDFYKTYTLDYHDGARYPHLERDAGKPDLLGEIAKPLAARP